MSYRNPCMQLEATTWGVLKSSAQLRKSRRAQELRPQRCKGLRCGLGLLGWGLLNLCSEHCAGNARPEVGDGSFQNHGSMDVSLNACEASLLGTSKMPCRKLYLQAPSFCGLLLKQQPIMFQKYAGEKVGTQAVESEGDQTNLGPQSTLHLCGIIHALPEQMLLKRPTACSQGGNYQYAPPVVGFGPLHLVEGQTRMHNIHGLTRIQLSTKSGAELRCLRSI